MSIALVEHRHQSLDTRSITSTGTSERAVTLKMPSLAKSIVRHRGGRTNSYEADNPFQPCIGPDTKGSSQHIVSRVQRSNSFQAAEMKHSTLAPLILSNQHQRGATERQVGFGREGPEIHSSPRTRKKTAPFSLLPSPSCNGNRTRRPNDRIANDFSDWTFIPT